MSKAGVPKRCANLISGESILNDGTAIVLFTLYLNLSSKDGMTWEDIIVFLLKNTLGASAFGVAWGLVGLVAIRLSRRSDVLVTVLSLVLPYLAFYCSFRLGMSGVLALVPLGLIFGFGIQVFAGSELHCFLESVWTFLEWSANTLVFFLSGVLIAEDILLDEGSADKWGFLFITYLVSQAVRLLIVTLFYPPLYYIPPSVTPQEASLLWWGGLRGAVGLSLAIVLKLDAPNLGEQASAAQDASFFMGGVVILTLLVNGTTAEVLIRKVRACVRAHECVCVHACVRACVFDRSFFRPLIHSLTHPPTYLLTEDEAGHAQSRKEKDTGRFALQDRSGHDSHKGLCAAQDGQRTRDKRTRELHGDARRVVATRRDG